MTGQIWPGRGDVFHWRHGWIPRDHAAALQKAHGSERGAARLAHRYGFARRGGELRGLSDDALAGRLGAASSTGEIDAVLAELDRRDKAAAKSARRRERRDAARESRYDELVNAGTDPEHAYAEAYGVPVARQRREAATAQLRANGYRGRSFDELTRAAHRDEVARLHRHAEDATRGALLNKAGQAKGISSRSLFTGNEATARKYASPELLAHWDQYGRLTLHDFRASLLGGERRHRTGGEDFLR